MNVKIQGGGNGEYANTGSSAAATRYLMHEEQEKAAIDVSGFFSHDADNISEGKVVYDLDHNKAKLCNSDSKFFVLTISPSKNEILQMGKTQEEQEKNFKDYIRGCVMNQYAENFGKGLNGSDIMYYGKIHLPGATMLMGKCTPISWSAGKAKTANSNFLHRHHTGRQANMELSRMASTGFIFSKAVNPALTPVSIM